MHHSVLQWAAQIIERDNLREREKILEIGSYDVNGSVRSFFGDRPMRMTFAGLVDSPPLIDEGDMYVGVDVSEGPGVDLVLKSRKLPFVPEQFDLVVSTEALEHDLRFWETLAEIDRVLRPGGRVILTARGMYLPGKGMPYHGDAHYKDAYRFLPDSVPTLCELMGCKLIEWTEDPQVPGLFIYGEKK